MSDAGKTDEEQQRGEKRLEQHERAVARALIAGTVTGALGSFAGATYAHWTNAPRVLRSALFTGSTFAAWSAGSIYSLERLRRRQNTSTSTPTSSALQALVVGGAWGGIIGVGSLGIRNVGRLLPVGLYFGVFAVLLDATLAYGLQRPRSASSPVTTDKKETAASGSSSFIAWLPIIGSRAARIDDLYKEIERLEERVNQSK